MPKLVLIVEFRADTQQEALDKAEALAKEAKQNRQHIGVRVAKNEAAARKYWAVRRESFNLLRKKVEEPPHRAVLRRLCRAAALAAGIFAQARASSGAVSAADLHGGGPRGRRQLCTLSRSSTRSDPTIARTLDELGHKIYDLVLSYHGSITGEHNDGLVRTPYVEKMFGPEMYALFHDVKNIFDPHNIFNPGKKVDGTFSDALTKLDLPKQK